MALTPTVAAAVRGSAQPMVYRDEPGCSPPPYPYCERQLPPQFFHHINQPADAPPEYNLYDVERGSLIDIVLSQYAQSINPGMASARYSILEQDEDSPLSPSPFLSHLRKFFFCCMAMLCRTTFALFWVFAIGYAIVVSFQKVAESLV